MKLMRNVRCSAINRIDDGREPQQSTGRLLRTVTRSAEFLPSPIQPRISGGFFLPGIQPIMPPSDSERSGIPDSGAPAAVVGNTPAALKP